VQLFSHALRKLKYVESYTIVTNNGTTTVQGGMTRYKPLIPLTYAELERQTIPTFHRVLCFDSHQLDYLCRLKKGSRVYVQVDYNIKEPEQGADPTTPQGQRHIFLTHGAYLRRVSKFPC
jgi:hypothetical protein